MEKISTRRMLALAIDLVILLILYGLFVFILDEDGGWIPFLIVLIVFCLLNSALEGMGGQTVGKLLLRVKVISTRFYKVNFPIALKRNIIKLLLLPLSAIGYVVSGNESEAWHDRLSGTEVIII